MGCGRGILVSYFNSALDSRREDTIARAFKFLRKRKDTFDAIAFSGMSGAAVAPILAYLLSKGLIIVRKQSDLEADNSHATGVVEYGGSEWQRVLIVDDFVSSGSTVKRIMEKIRDVRFRAEFVAVYCYELGYDYTKQMDLHLPECWSGLHE